MIIVRETWTAKPGQASKLAKMFKKMFGSDSRIKIMTDLISQYNTVIVDMEVESLADWEKEMEEYMSGKKDPNMTPELQEEFKHYTEMFLTGKREVFKVE